MLHKQLLKKQEVVNRWENIIKMKNNINNDADATSGKYWHNGQPFPYSAKKITLKSAHTLVFIQAYTLLNDVEKSCLHKGLFYKSEKDIKNCNKVRNQIAHDYKLLDRKTSEELLEYIKIELKYWKLIQ